MAREKTVFYLIELKMLLIVKYIILYITKKEKSNFHTMLIL